MKNVYFTCSILWIASGFSLAQKNKETFAKQYEPIKKELHAWDQVRGPWLSESAVSVTNQEAVPVRNFSDNVTPRQLMNSVPPATQDRINTIIQSHRNDPETGAYWQDVSSVLVNNGCAPVRGRSYGDPHLESFDGARYSFQTVGEFVLLKSNNGKVEVQTRQKAQNENFSLNTAVSMNVNGDRVSIYAEDYPDPDRSTPVRVNGNPVSVGNTPHTLANGGVIRRSRGLYVVDWPTGESAIVEIRDQARGSFMNVSVDVYPCKNGGYGGLFGNANGFVNDDYNTSRGASPVAMNGIGMVGESAELIERQRLAYLAQEFADEHRITQASSLFDYPIGTSTLTFTDRTFPRVHMTLNDLSVDQRDKARRHCEENGISGNELNACIYDNGFLGIQPTKKHLVEDPSIGTRDVRGDTGNDTPDKVREPIRENTGTREPNKPSTEGVVKEPVRNGTDPAVSGGSTPRNNGTGNTVRPQPSTPRPNPTSPTPSTPRPTIATPRSNPSNPSPSIPKSSPGMKSSGSTIRKM